MRPNPVIIGLGSLLLLLAGALVWAKRPAESSPSVGISAPVPAAAPAAAPREAAAPAVSAPPQEASKPKVQWSSIESSDYKQYIANLRAINCPEQTIQDIIIADVNKLYEPKEAP